MRMTPRTMVTSVVAAAWLLGAIAAASWGNSHGLIDHRIDPATLPYAWQGVVTECVVIGIESLALRWLLLNPRWRPLGRTLAALAVFLGLALLSLSTFYTDLPAWYYVHIGWTWLVLVMLAIVAVAQGLGLLVARLRA